MKQQFLKDRKAEIELLKQDFQEEILTETKLNTLPKGIQRYFRLCGFVGKPIAMNADVIWKESFIKLKPRQAWKALDTLQFNSVKPIMRTAFMKVKKMFFAGKDLYKNGQGTMKGKILNLFLVIDAKGRELSQSALITSFCEMMLVSGYAFQDYIVWQEIDDCTVGAQLIDHDFKVNGTFHFSQEGKFEYFETDDRYFDAGGGKYSKRRFVAQIKSYIRKGDYYQPDSISASWILDDEEYEYFKGKIERMDYNVK
ncbi:MAG: DUF6544 family protein [Bacteroidota bacterium]